MVEHESQPETEATPAPLMTLKVFLETVPPSQMRHVQGVLFFDDRNNARLRAPDLELHCPKCGGERVFRLNKSESPYLYLKEGIAELFLDFLCSNCQEESKRYSLVVIRDEKGTNAEVYKYSELPPFGQPTPTRLLEMLGDQKELFLKGRRCEFQGLGVGAFTYYRRVVEHQRSSIIDEIIKAASRLNASEETLAALAAAKKETQFSKSVGLVKDAIPQALLVHGHNPLTILHTALSDGLHDRSDEHCLELAHDIRVILADLAERISQVLKDHAELKASITRLLNRDPK